MINLYDFVNSVPCQSVERVLLLQKCFEMFIYPSLSMWVELTSVLRTLAISNLITVQQDATYSVYYTSVGSSTCFGC